MPGEADKPKPEDPLIVGPPIATTPSVASASTCPEPDLPGPKSILLNKARFSKKFEEELGALYELCQKEEKIIIGWTIDGAKKRQVIRGEIYDILETIYCSVRGFDPPLDENHFEWLYHKVSGIIWAFGELDEGLPFPGLSEPVTTASGYTFVDFIDVVREELRENEAWDLASDL